MQKSKTRPSTALIVLCWFVYTCSCIGKLNYPANINSIMDFFGVNHSSAGLASTLFFFSYSIGQFVNGVLCKKYNLKWVIFASLTVSAIINLIVGVTDDFELVKYLWLINGFSMSVFWPSLIRLLSQSLSRGDMPRASVVMGTTVATGTLVIYGMSALLVKLDFKLSFYLATVTLLAAAVIWLLSFSRVVDAASAEAEADEKEMNVSDTVNGRGGVKGALLLSIVMLCFYGVATNLIRDGLVGWVPSIMKEQYGVDASFSIILTLLLPVVSIFGNSFAVSMHKRIHDYVLQCMLTFLGAGLIIGVVIGGVSLDTFWVTIIGFVLVCFLISSCNSVITSIFPLFLKGKVNSGLVAGVLNGCSYIGSTISAYGLGVIADNFGWIAVFWTLLSVCALVCVGALVYIELKRALEKKTI